MASIDAAVHGALRVDGDSDALVGARSRANREQSYGSFGRRWSRTAGKSAIVSPHSPSRWRHRHKIPKQLQRIRAQGPGNGDKLDHVDPPLAALIFGDEGLRPARAFLAKAC